MPRVRPLRWRFGAKRFDASSVAFHVDGHDLIHICDIDANGNAVVVVYDSPLPDAAVVFHGVINIDPPKEKHAPLQDHGVPEHRPQHRAGD
jgi:hypothetical protein